MPDFVDASLQSFFILVKWWKLHFFLYLWIKLIMFHVSYFISTLNAFNTLIQVIYRIHARYEEEGSFCAFLCFLARFLPHRVFMSSGLTGRSIRLYFVCILLAAFRQTSLYFKHTFNSLQVRWLVRPAKEHNLELTWKCSNLHLYLYLSSLSLTSQGMDRSLSPCHYCQPLWIKH